MTAFLDIDIIGTTAQADRMLDYLYGILSPVSMGAFLGLNIGPYLQSRARDRFQQEGDDVSGEWHPLSQVTQEIRARAQYGPSHPINQRTGELVDYITKSQFSVVASDVGAILTYPPKRTTSRRKSLRAKMTAAQRGKIKPRTPARPVLGMNETDLAFVITTLAFYIQKGGGKV